MPPDPRSDSRTDPRTDQQLIAAINAGRAPEQAFETLYLRYQQWAANLAYRFIGDRDLALDVTQETFIYVLRKFPGFTLTAQFKTFLYPVVRHLAVAARQKSRRHLTIGNGDADEICDPAPPATFASAMDPQSPLGDLANLVGSLPPAQREVLTLRFVDDLPLHEIAEALGVPLGTVKSRLHNALETLRHDPRTRSYFE